MKRNLLISEQLAYSTARIQCENRDGSISTGTGFFFNFEFDGKSVQSLVTNKHVVSEATEGIIYLHTSDSDGNPELNNSIRITIVNFEKAWLKHPDDKVDLCVMPTSHLHEQAMSKGMKIFTLSFDPSIILNDEELKSITALEDVVMIGYPNGIWDSYNNMPIFRRGITATHPFMNYEGKEEFLIDAACFPGSSGSPIVLLNIGSYATMSGGVVFGSRFKFLGVLYAGPQHTAEGKVEIINVPTKERVVSISRIPNNLGLCIKSKRILDFIPLIKDKLKESEHLTTG